MGYYRKNDDYGWPAYVSVAEKKQQATKKLQDLQKKGQKLNPIVIAGRLIAATFWGKAWCKNLESYSSYVNRLPRGRSYVRNGAVIDLNITKGQINAQVMGSSLYRVTIDLKPMVQDKWKILVKACSGKIDSLIELLQGKFSKAVMETITEKEGGLFPNPKEISMKCSCPDSVSMCKHIAAVLYGVGASLDEKPEWLFTLRHVDHVDLIASAGTSDTLLQNQVGGNELEDADLANMFGIEMDNGTSVVALKPVKGVKTVKADKAVKPVLKPKKKVSIPMITKAKEKLTTKVAVKVKDKNKSIAKKLATAKATDKVVKKVGPKVKEKKKTSPDVNKKKLVTR